MKKEERQLLVGVARVIREMVSSPDVYPLVTRAVDAAFRTAARTSPHGVDLLSALIGQVATAMEDD